MKCRPCQGEGEVSYEEDGRMVTDVCYHCAGSGSVDEETDFHDRLASAASTLAHQAESEYRSWCNADPEGDGYDLHAAENMLHPNEYFRIRVWERAAEIGEKIAEMPRADQELLVALNEMEPIIIKRDTTPSPPPDMPAWQPTALGDDDIPF